MAGNPSDEESHMDLVVLDEREILYALRVLRTVVASNGTITFAESRFIEVIAELHGMRVDAGSSRGIESEEVAKAITQPHQRKRVVQLAVIAAMVEGDVIVVEVAVVKALAIALEVDEASLKVLEDIVANYRFFIWFDIMRRIMGKVGSRAYREEGLAGVGRMLAPFLGTEDPRRVEVQVLGLLPEGTLGRAFWEHSTRNRFGFPGEKGGIPERMVYYDFGHVLANYDTTPEMEIQQNAFQAEFTRQDGFAFLMFAIIQFHLGVKVTPVTEGRTGLFDVAKVLRAV
jgi:hypothetical protein